MTVRRASRLLGESCPCVFVGTLNFGGLLHRDLLIYGVSLYEEGMKTARCFRVLAGIGIFPLAQSPGLCIRSTPDSWAERS